MGEATRFLQEWRTGDAAARNALLEVIYGDLRQRAARLLSGRSGRCALQPTELVSESFLKLTNLDQVGWQDRNHFLAVASRVMRQVLSDSGRYQNARKRGGMHVTLVTAHLVDEATELPFDELEQALQELSEIDHELAEVVELKFFSGMTNQEMAECLGCSESTVKRSWRAARAWLLSRLSHGDTLTPAGSGPVHD